jgi:PAS domain S-box-containing protein
MQGAYIEEYEYDIQGTPCEPVVETRCPAHVASNVIELFPEDPDLPALGAVSYLGTPLLDPEGALLGHLAAIDTKPMPAEPHLETVLGIFAERAAAEFLRLRAEEGVRAREEELSLLLDTAMDAVLILDRRLAIVRANPAASRSFGAGAAELAGRDLRDLLEVSSLSDLTGEMQRLDGLPEEKRRAWLPRILECRRVEGLPFPAEATLSSFESRGARYYTLILRNVHDRIEAERRIELLTEEAEYLREAVRDAPGSERILGENRCMKALLGAIGKVAPTEATVLVLGETGTGKELIARSIHHGSPRSARPLVRVNCAAIPGTLIESELFGHERGAFTGATARREGRFELADGGSIFLDEIGELPLDLQAKLLRVLQEGEFEPIGSTRTRRVDVRVIAATNRDLDRMVAGGEFREDLFYRLNVFPIRVPPLRERGEDVVLLARGFVERFARRMGRRIARFLPEEERMLRAYAWPGNVRELQNVIERALILASGDRIALSAAMPAGTAGAPLLPAPEPEAAPPARILRAEELQALERENIVRALEAAAWKVAGAGGAAHLLGLPPSTLSSRMKALGIRRPRGG